MMRAEIRMLECKHSDLLIQTLKPETATDLPRTKVEIGTEEGGLVIRVMAEDATALRAALNSYIRWLKLALDTEEVIGGT
jgi:KEOPS complex subunit Pcc1